MPTFNVVKKHDSFNLYSKDFEAATAEEAFAKGSDDRRNAGWDFEGVQEFDDITMELEDVTLVEEVEDLTSITMNSRHRDTVIAALRMWQETPDEQRIPYAMISNDSGEGDLTEEEIDVLIAEINL